MDLNDLLIKLISFKTITPKEEGIFDFIEQYLGETWIRTNYDCNEVKNCVFTKTFSEKDIHFGFCAHVDVVGVEDNWSSDPFKGEIKNNFIFGRGSSDMKGGLSAVLYSLKNFQYGIGKISLILTSDEEGNAINGTRYILEKLNKQNLIPRYLLNTEPTSQNKYLDTIKTSRRGSINGKITILTSGGHSAYSNKAISSISYMNEFVSKFDNYCFDNGNSDFESSKLVVTNVFCGNGNTNVIAGKCEIMFNVRNNDLTNKEQIMNFLSKELKEIVKNGDFLILLDTGSEYFKGNSKSEFVKLFKLSVKDIMGYEPKICNNGGTSDSRFFSKYDCEIIDFGPNNETIHKANECIDIKELSSLQKCISNFLYNYLEKL